MKCFNHDTTDAVAVCSYCGQALCKSCVQPRAEQRLVCSSECAEALSCNRNAIQMILQQNLRSAKASAFYCYLCAALSAGAAVVAWFMLPSPFLILFTGACAVVLFVSGVWYDRNARKKSM